MVHVYCSVAAPLGCRIYVHVGEGGGYILWVRVLVPTVWPVTLVDEALLLLKMMYPEM